MNDNARGPYAKTPHPCKHNTCVDCGDQTGCGKCGWDPTVSEARRNALRTKYVKPKRRVVALRA